MQSGIKSLVSEELGLDNSNIYVAYMDFDSYTSDEIVGKWYEQKNYSFERRNAKENVIVNDICFFERK